MKKPFYLGVICSKACKDLWQARKPGVCNGAGTPLTGAGRTAELAIADLQKQLRAVKKEVEARVRKSLS